MTQTHAYPATQASEAALRITVTETSTVFTGVANLHRMDAPSAREIANYVRNVFGPEPAGAHVHVAASPARLAELEAALAGYEIRLTTEALPDDADTNAFGLYDSGDLDVLVRGVDAESGRRPEWVVLAVAAAVAVVCAVVIGMTAANLVGRSAPVGEHNAADQNDAGMTPTDSEDAPGSAAAVTEASTSEQAADTVVLERDGVRVELPAGFELEDVDGMWRATGPDPDFRLLISVDELYNLPAETMAEQLLRDVEADPETELVDTDGHSLTYRELPADGSEVLWKTWPHDNYQVFVACHTRSAPTTVQQATCRMAFESAVFEPSDPFEPEEEVGAMSG
ncbi:hypothetical protein CGLAUT_02205 [Corynebacterium glaucum]|uniref:type VII secretion-associated protein n=1 Tax=Corynebacterium glaucum TaxID=187491 RepID=UPI0025B4D3C5|nr:type VII secretion-associated protein [Corynebacterium glaucum]WJZ06947.1 hypothetical protein CGLAUT_02205 [Corynebacterium glaucum]